MEKAVSVIHQGALLFRYSESSHHGGEELPAHKLKPSTPVVHSAACSRVRGNGRRRRTHYELRSQLHDFRQKLVLISRYIFQGLAP
jgi:hypothetical protein